MGEPWIRVLACGSMAAARLVELVHSRRNLRNSGLTVEGPWSARTYPAMVLLHTLVIAATLLRGTRGHWGWLAVLIGVQPLRLWVLLLLGE